MNKVLRPSTAVRGYLSILFVSLWLASCGGGGGGGSTVAPTPEPDPPTTPTSVNISGNLTFDRVPHLQTGSGLDYDSISQEPIRGAVVEAANSSGTVLASTSSDSNGAYSLTVDADTDVRIQVKAQLLQTSGARWDVKVTDNTNGNALYVLAGSVANSGTADSTRDLNAGSGWGGSSYTQARSAAPFAILSPIYDVVQKFSEVDQGINFPEVEFRWSVNNFKVPRRNLEEGEIGSSFYNGQAIYILGHENTDTDEYDGHIIIHEWGHYFEDKLSRADSVGGPHAPGDGLDMRVAFGEGFGNALSGIITDDPFYRDSFGNQQSSAFFINVENNNNINAGWFSEGSVQSILYDLYDSEDDGADTLSFGLKPMYDTLVDPDYTQNQFFTSIFSFINHYRDNLDNPAASSAQITGLLQAQDIFGTGDNGAGETNDAGGTASVLPVYTSMSIAGSPYTICSIDDFGSVNKLGNRVFGQITFNTGGSYTLEMTRVSGVADRDPDFILSSAGRVIERAESEAVDTESTTADFDAGTFALEAYDFKNIDSANGNNGDSCYEFSIQAN